MISSSSSRWRIQSNPRVKRAAVALGMGSSFLLRFEQPVDPLVDGVDRDNSVHEALVLLGEPVDPVLSLLVVFEPEASVIEDDVLGHREREALLAASRSRD